MNECIHGCVNDWRFVAGFSAYQVNRIGQVRRFVDGVIVEPVTGWLFVQMMES